MHASLIQEFPKTDHSKRSDNSKDHRTNQPKDSFQKQFDAELSTKKQEAKKTPDAMAKELEEAAWISAAPSTQSISPTKLRFESVERPNPEVLNRVNQEPGSGKSATESEKTTPQSKTPDPKTNSENKDSTGKGEHTDKHPSGKNVSYDNNAPQGEAKTSTRPTLGGNSPLTYGSVKPAENMLMNASSAASSSSQAIPIHHGTQHASGNSQPNESINTQKTKDPQTMSTLSTSNPIRIKEIAALDGARQLILQGNAERGAGDSTSFGASFSNGGQEESGAFSDKDSGNNAQIQSIAKTPLTASSSSSAMVDSIRKIQTMIQDQVVIMKNAPGQSMQVMLRPDANMALFLTLQQSDSDVVVAAKMDQSTSNLLKPHWEEIQKELSQQGIRLGNPELNSNQDSSTRHGNTQDNKNDDAQNIFSNRSQESAQRAEMAKETTEISEPDFDNMEGTLVSWA